MEGTDANSILSKKSNLGIGNTIEQARSSYINNTNTDLKYNNASSSNLSYIFTAKTNASFIAIPFGSNKTVSTTPKLTNLSISSNGNANKLSQNDIQNIIDNSNNKLNDTINDSLNNCIKNIIPHDNYISSTGEVVINGSNDSTQWLKLGTLTLNPGDYTLLANTGNSDITLVIDELRDYDTSTTKQFTLTSSILSNVFIRVSPGTYNNVKFKPAILTGNSTSYILPNQQKCSSKLDDTNDKLNDTNDKLDDLNNTINNDDTSSAVNKANDFFSGFTTDTFGLTSIITSPLTLIGSITSSTCSPLSLKIPFLEKNNNLQLPCMSTIYQDNFGSFLTVYQTITFGITAYWVCIKIFALVKDFKNPDEDKVEVLDL